MSDVVIKVKVAKKAATPAAHPKFAEMIQEAIVVLKERSGSSVQAITKFVGAKYGSKMPPTYPKLISNSLKKMTVDEKLVKVKASYKLGDKLKLAPKKKVAKKVVKKVVKKKAVKTAVKKIAAKKPAGKKPAAAKTAKKAAAPKIKKAAAPKKPSGVKKVKTAKKSTTPKKKAAPKKA